MTQTSPLPAGGTINARVTDGVGTIEFHHPKGNSLPGQLLMKLAEIVTTFGEHPRVQVIVMRSGGAGPFCSGASFDELTAISEQAQGAHFFSGFARVILAMSRVPKFVLTRVQGKAAGGALGLIAASDYSFAVRNASAKLSELAIGIGPFVVGPVIEKKIGTAAFSAMAVDADWRDAAWCERHSLYSQLFDDEASMDVALNSLAKKLAASNPEAMAELKRTFWAGTEQWDSLLADRAGMSGRMVLSEFTKNAIAEFRKR